MEIKINKEKREKYFLIKFVTKNWITLKSRDEYQVYMNRKELKIYV